MSNLRAVACTVPNILISRLFSCSQGISPLAAVRVAMLVRKRISAIVGRVAGAAAAPQQHHGDVRRARRRGRK